jgi:two-component system response regulator LytT
MIHCIYYVI